MRDVEKQLADYFDRIVERITPEDVMIADTRVVADDRQSDRRTRPSLVFGLAAAAVVVAIGVTGVFVFNPATDTADQPVHAPVAAVTAEELASWSWSQVAPGEVWSGNVVDVERYGGEGFVALVRSGGTVYWSPNGEDWLDADPDRQVTPLIPAEEETQVEAPLIAVAGDRLILLGGTANDPGVWVGNPDSGSWKLVPLDPDGLTSQVALLSVAAHDQEVLVVAAEIGEEVHTLVDEEGEVEPLELLQTIRYVAWTVDLDSGETERSILPIGGREWTTSQEAFATRYQSNWIVALLGNVWTAESGEGWDRIPSILSSPDGATWTLVTTTADLSSITSLTAGSSSLIATVCNFGGDTFLVSPDGQDWTPTSTGLLGHRSTHSPALGFLIVYDGVLHSADGATWRTVGGGPGRVQALAANNIALLAARETGALWIYDGR